MALERQDLSRTYLAHHKLESAVVNINTVESLNIIVVNIIILLLLLLCHCYYN